MGLTARRASPEIRSPQFEHIIRSFHDTTKNTPLSCRPCRQPAAPAGAPRRARQGAGREDKRRRAQGGPGQAHPRRGRQAGVGRHPVGDRRRVPPRLVAHRLPLQLRRRDPRQGRRVRRREIQGHGGAAAVHEGHEQDPAHQAVDARSLQVPKVGGEEHAQVHHASPAMLHGRADRASIKKTYPDLDEFWADLTKAYREEIADLYKAGCRYLQIDDTTIAMMGDPKVQENFRKLGDDPKKDNAMYAEAVNAAIRDVPDDMAVAIHTCRGNFKSTWLASGSYDYVAETVFSRLDVDAFFLEYDTDRAGGFEPLRFVPKGKIVVLGLVSSKVPELEK